MREASTVDNVTQNLLLGQCPLTAGVVNAIFVFVTFLLSLPALFLPTNRGWLRAQGWLVVICATFTLTLGVAIWVETLQTRRNLRDLWGRETPQIQSLLQQKVDLTEYQVPRECMLTHPSSIAADTSMPLHLLSYRTLLARTLSSQRRRADASPLSLHSPTSILTGSSPQPSVLSVSISSLLCVSPWSSSTGWSRSATGTLMRRTVLEDSKDCTRSLKRRGLDYKQG